MKMLKVAPGELQFGTLAINETPAYCRFCVKNTDSYASLSVKLSATTVPSAIRFQLSDSKLQLDDDEVDGSALNESSSQTAQILTPNFYNAAFDSINVIESLELQPLEEQEIIAIFSPEPGLFSNIVEQTPPTLVNGVIQLTSTSSRTSVMRSLSLDNSVKRTSTLGSAATYAYKDHYNPSHLHSSYSADNVASYSPVLNGVPALSNSSSLHAAVRSETVTIPFSATVFLSVLTVSQSELQATMAPNRTHLMEFSVANISPLPLPFVIRTQTMPHKNVEVAVYEGKKFELPQIGRVLLLRGHASMNFTIMIHTAAGAELLASGETIKRFCHRTILQCDNLRDTRNSALVCVNVNVVPEHFQTRLVSVADPNLDFGGVYRGTRVVREVSICNISREDLTVRLLDSRPQHCEGMLTLVRGPSGAAVGGQVVDSIGNGDTGTKATDGSKDTTASKSSYNPHVPVDEVVIAAQKGALQVAVMYVASTDSEHKGTASLNFELDFVITACGGGTGTGSGEQQQRVVVHCIATLFTSTIVAPQNHINIGDCTVGQSRRCTFYIENPSPLPTAVQVQLRSKIVSIEGVPPRLSATGVPETVGEFSIAPQSSLPLTLRLTPQRVNPTYRKQLTVVNVSNPAEDRLILTIEANNMPPAETELHNEFYTWDCKPLCHENRVNPVKSGAGGANGSEVDERSGGGAPQLRAIANVPLIVACTVHSRVEYPLVLQLHTTGSEIDTFSLEGMPMADFEALAVELHSCCFGDDDMGGKPLPERAEEAWDGVMRALRNHALPAASVILEPRGRATVYVCIQRNLVGITDAVTKEDGINIAVDNVEARRFIRLSYRVYSTRFELGGQKTKHFGEVNVGERKTTKLLIINQCNSLLLLRVTKSRSVMAGYIRMDNSDRNSIYFRIRPYANRELELAFCPGLKGSLEEHIQFTNILNPRNEVVMTVKATVTKAETFDVSPDSWSFGLVPVPMLQQNDNSCPTGAVGAESATAKGSVGTVQDESGRPAVRVGARFTVSNTSSTRRALRLKLDSTPNIAGGNAGGGGEWTPCPTDRFFKFEGIDVRLQLDMEHGGSCSGSSRKLEEKIEKLEQKLKIYHRKNKADKVTAAVRQIEELKRALKGEVVVINDPEQTEDEMKGKDSHQCQLQSAPSHTTVSGDEGDESSATTKVLLREHGELLSMLLRDGIALSEINAGESVILVLGITCVRTCEHIPAAQSGTITFVLYEANDTEASRAIPVDITLIRVEGETDVKTSAPAELMTPSEGKRQSESGPGEVVLSPTHLRSPRSSSRPKSDTQSPLHAGGELPGGATNQARPAAAASAGSPSFITLELGEGVASSTFMCFPMISINNCMVQEQYEFTFFVCASGDTSVVVQDPIRCCSPNLVNGNNFGGDNDNCGEVASMKHMVPVITADGNESFLPPVLPTLPTAVKTLDAHFSFSRQGGAVPSRQPLPIIVRCIPVCGGPQHYFIPVTNLQDGGNTTYLVVFLNPILASELMLKVSPSTLFMPDIILPYEGGLPDVQSFTVRSNIVQSHALLIRSNRPSLVRLFEDAKCNVPLRNPIRCPSAQKKTRLYVQFCPSAHLRRHSSRMMSAGILIEAITPTGGSSQSNNTDLDHTRQWGYAVLSHCIVRVSARVGSGDLVLRESFIDLGAVDPSCQKTEATVTVWNPSDHFEIHGRLSASLPLTEISVPEFKLSPGEMIDVPITLHLPAPGLVRESISLHNLSCGQKPLKARLTVLRHDEAISVGVSPYGTLGRSSFSLASASQGLGCSVVVFPTAPVVLGDGGVFRLHSPVISTAMHITNNSMRCLILVARSSVPFVFGPADRTSHASDVPMDCEDGLGSMFAPSTLDSSPSSTTVAEIEVDPDVEDKTSSHSCARGRLLLEAQQTQSVAWTLTALPPLTLKQRQQLQQREVVTVEATAYVYVGQVVDEAFAFPFNDMFFAARQLPVAEQCVLIPKFLLNFALSEGRVEPPLIDLGVVVARNNGTASAALTSSGTENPVPFASTKVTGDVSEQGRQRHLASVANPVPWSEGRDGGGVNPVVFMHLVNLSPILPLQLSVECPPTVHFAHNRITVPPSQTLTVEAIVLPKLIQSQGPFRIAVYFVNEQNPENDMVVYVTGLCYRKLFKLSWEGSVNDGKESLSMQPLRLENLGDAVSAVLSQTKITMTAVEPNIEVGVRVTVNPKLEGVLQLQAQQYGASAPLQTIIFGHAQPVAVGGNANINTNSNNNAGGVVTGVAVGGSSIAASAAATSGGAITNTQLPALGHSAHGAGWAGGGVGPGGMNNGCGNGSEGVLIPAVPGKGVVVCTKDHQSFRLRCILAKEDFAALAGVFFGQRKHMSTSDIIHKRQELAFDKLEEIKEQRSAVSKTMWLGTMYFSNRLTGNDEEVQIFSTLSAFCTFKVASKLLLRPRCPATAADTVEYWETCGLAIAHVGIRATASDALHVYEGELVVSNPCQEHTVRLSITPLLNHAHHDRVALQCIPLDERAAAKGKESSSACVSISSGCPGDCKDDVVDANRSGIVSPTPAISPSPCHPPEGELVASQKFNDSSAVTHTTTVIVSVPPQGEVRARVLLYVDGALNKSSVEQAAGIALFDESVSSSAAAVRVSLAPMDENVRERQQQQQADQLFRQSARHVDPLSGVISSATSHKGAKDGMVEADKGIISAECKVSSGYNTAGKDAPDASSSGDRKTRWSPSATRTRVRRVLTLHGNCAEMPDCSGAYTCSFSFSKDSPPTTDITISNNISDTEVEYTVAVLSQGPQPWLLLPVASAVLGPGENQPLRLNILSTDAGSFVGHIVISSSAAPGEPLLLRLNAEVFLPTAGEGLFDILSSNGQRLSSGMEKEVFVGRLFGEKTHCAYVALEIVNRSSVPLEFPVSVGKSLRIEFVNIPGEEVSEKGNAAAVGATDGNLQQGLPKMRESDDDELGRELREASNNSNNSYGSKGGSNPPTAVASPRCCVRLLVCHLHGVSAMRGERYFVVDPKSRVKVAFLLVCDQLSLPGGLLASGEAEVVLTCKQARDARFVFRTRFQVCRPSFAVQQEHIFTQNEKYTVGLVVKNLCQRELCVLFRTASPMLVVEETPDRDGERSYTMVTIAGGATATINVQFHISNLAALYNWGGANCGGNGGDDRPSSVGSDVNVLLQPVSDHGVLLNVRNPSERVRVEFCYAPPATIQESPGLFLSEIEAVVAYPYSKSAKLARRLNYEKWLYQFFQDFTRVLSEVAELLLPEIREYALCEGLDLPSLCDTTGAATSNGRSGLFNSHRDSTDRAFAASSGSAGSPVNTNVCSGSVISSGEQSGGKDDFPEGSGVESFGDHGIVEDRMAKGGRHAHCRQVLRKLLVDLSWLVEELVYYSIMLGNSRAIEAYSVLLSTFVGNHQLLRAWQQHRGRFPLTHPFAIFEQFIETIDALPR